MDLGQPYNKITISQVVGLYKSSVTRKVNKKYNCNIQVWQRNFFEHIIRTEEEYFYIKQYIKNNIINWNDDQYC